MDWNIGNSTIFILSSLLVVCAIWRLLRGGKRVATSKYLSWLLITSGMTIIQVILVDAKVVNTFPIFYIFFIPWQFLAPVFFSLFICSYLDRMWEFKKYKELLLTPFVLFFILYIVLKVNAFTGYTFFSKEISLTIGAEWDENLAVLFAFINGIWNYRTIKSYERSLLGASYKTVIEKTNWLRIMYTLLVVLCSIWILVILYLKVTKFERGMMAYYPLWFLFLGFYFVFLYIGDRHLKTKKEEEKKRQVAFESIVTDFQIEGLNKIFESKELQNVIDADTYDVTRVLSYFATSLFDKRTVDDVLWDIVRNAIGKLDLEDCVIYMLDTERNVLVQKAAYGNKDKGTRKVVSPIEIPFGEGIVGAVAKTCKWECISDVNQDARYVIDDMQRQSELAVPIHDQGTILGVLDSEHSEKEFFKKQHIFIFQLIAKLTATKIKQLVKKEVTTITNDNGYYKELCFLLENEKIYKNPDISLGSIAARLDISVTYLSQLINRISGVNFSDFINEYRVKESQRLLTHPNYTGYAILSIGLESGFNSKSTFYAAFKKHTGVTPSVYRVKAPFES
ncbi:helix-turn-helix domain-containing protein [uncultured Dokdonia sp.]|uniref:helix-turn-helix domain-containing protein n=1 Tax=uncultured Dokdonia sp. TaxID=575653 RepID=UPI002601F77E|nr:helix-turn-helix domain-containing protein [uncultured Dokdonia sp.]